MGKASRQKRAREPEGRSEPTKSGARAWQPRTELQTDVAPPWLHVLAMASLAVLAGAVYYPCLTGEFVFDDHNAIQQSLLVRALWPLTRFLTHSNRPLVDFTYAINYAQGEYDTWWYHFTNIAIHAGTAMVVYALVSRTLRLPSLAERYGGWSQAIAWLAAALFTCHPLASEAVAYISSRYESMAGLFYLATILVYTYAVAATSERARQTARYGLAISTALAVACKEIAATIPLALLLYDYVFVARGNFAETRGRLLVIGHSLILLIVAGLYLAIRAFTSDQVHTPYQQSAGFGFDRYTPAEFFATQVGVIVHYLRLCFFPTGLTFDYDWTLARSFFDISVLGPMLLLLGLAALAWRSIRSQPVFAFAVFFLFIVLAPTSSIMPLADLAVERRMYIPLAGFCFLAAATLADLARNLLAERGLPALTAAGLALVAVAAVTTHARAVQWGDHLVLYEDAVLKTPGSPRVRLNLGVIHLNAGRYDEAHEVLFDAKEIYDRGESIHAFPRIGAFIYYNLGAIQFIRQEYADSERYMVKSIQEGGQYVALRPRAYAVLGQIYRMREEYDRAIASFEEALKYNQDYPDWMYALVETHILAGNYAEARKVLFQLEHVHPELAEAQRGKDLRKDILQSQRADRLYEAQRKRERMRRKLAEGLEAPDSDSDGAPE